MKDWRQMPKQFSQTCPLCGARLDDNDLDILEEHEMGLLIYSNCVRCKVGMLAKLTVVPQGFVGVGMLTDLQRDEVIVLASGSPVSAEDVLSFKQLADKGVLELK